MSQEETAATKTRRSATAHAVPTAMRLTRVPLYEAVARKRKEAKGEGEEKDAGGKKRKSNLRYHRANYLMSNEQGIVDTPHSRMHHFLRDALTQLADEWRVVDGLPLKERKWQVSGEAVTAAALVVEGVLQQVITAAMQITTSRGVQTLTLDDVKLAWKAYRGTLYKLQ